MVKIFLSQPMTGYTDSEVIEERVKMLNAMVDEIRSMSLDNSDPEILEMLQLNVSEPIEVSSQREFINQIDHNKKFCETHSDWTPKDLIMEDLKLMTAPDVIVIFHPKFKKSVGCSIEYQICKSYGIPHLFLTKDWKLVRKRPKKKKKQKEKDRVD